MSNQDYKDFLSRKAGRIFIGTIALIVTSFMAALLFVHAILILLEELLGSKVGAYASMGAFLAIVAIIIFRATLRRPLRDLSNAISSIKKVTSAVGAYIKLFRSLFG